MKDRGTTRKERQPRRRGRTAALVLGLIVGSMTVPLLFASPALAATIDCSTNYTTAQCQVLTPTVACVWTNANGSHTAAFGYTNTSATNDITVNLGRGNRLSAGSVGTPPTFFPRGTSVTAFTVTYTRATSTWRLVGKAARASATSPHCSSPPVPGFGGTAAFLGMLLMSLPMLLLIGRGSRRERQTVRVNA